MAKKILTGIEARKKLKEGIDQLASVVGATLGPMGRNVIIKKSWGPPHITKDGVTVAKDIELEDEMADIGNQMIRQASEKTNEEVGDGTTTSTILAQEMVAKGMIAVNSGATPVEIKKGMELALVEVVKYLDKIAVPVELGDEKIKQIAAVSANNNKEIGDLVSNALTSVGKDGVVTVEESKNYETTIEDIPGMQFENGFLSPYFITDPKSTTCVYEEPLIFVYNDKLNSPAELATNVIGLSVDRNNKSARPLIIICNDIDPQTLGLVVMNRVKGALPIAVVKAPGFGEARKEYLDDIAVFVGAKMCSKTTGEELTNFTESQFGGAARVRITKNSTTIVDGFGKPEDCLLYTSPSPRDLSTSRMPSSA